MAKPLEVFFDPEVQRLIDSFAFCFRVKITVFSPEMEELIVGFQNTGAHYCSLIQTTLKIRYRCLRQDALMCESSKKHNRLMVYRCHAGLSEAVLPIRIDENLIGYAMLGQFRLTDKLPSEMKIEWNNAGFEQKTLVGAFLGQPYFEKETLSNMLELFTMMISFIITRDYVRFRQPTLVEAVVKWIDENIDKPATLTDVAQHVNRSPSTISHSLKKQLGLSFKQLAAIKKVQKFESLIARNHDLSIKEASRMVGFDDPLYFSRLYKKIRLSPPSSYIQSFRETSLREEKFS